jgi:hypothetical protein
MQSLTVSATLVSPLCDLRGLCGKKEEGTLTIETAGFAAEVWECFV